MSSPEENGLPPLPDRWPRWVYGAGRDPEVRLSHRNARTLRRRLLATSAAGGTGLAGSCLLGSPASPRLALGLMGAGVLLAAGAALGWAHTERDLRVASARNQSQD